MKCFFWKICYSSSTFVQVYLSLDKHVAGSKLTVTDGRELEQLHFILRDFAVLLQVGERVRFLVFYSKLRMFQFLPHENYYL